MFENLIKKFSPKYEERQDLVVPRSSMSKTIFRRGMFAAIVFGDRTDFANKAMFVAMPFLIEEAAAQGAQKGCGESRN